MQQSKYSKLTLAPFDGEEKIKFRKFRDEDVIIVYNYMCIMAAFEAFVLAMFFTYSVFTEIDVKRSLIKFIYQMLVAIITGSVWSLGQRFRRQYTLMIGVSFVVI